MIRSETTPTPNAPSPSVSDTLTPIRPAFEGPVDLIGDIHGEHDALLQLLAHLGYDSRGHHPDNRRLIFVGDLVDRGPDNVSVVRLVQTLVETGRAQCILGNHELNLLRRTRKDGNSWFYGDVNDAGRPTFRETLGSDQEREEMLAFFRGLPMALERPDLRVVHACWDDGMIERLRRPVSAIGLFFAHEARIAEELVRNPAPNAVEATLALQNRNPVKVTTSGPEQPHPGFVHNGKTRYNARMPWWRTYEGPVFTVFGHYSRVSIDGHPHREFGAGDEPDRTLGGGRCTCIDLAGGWRVEERRRGVTENFVTRQTALRWPERELVDDQGLWRPLRD